MARIYLLTLLFAAQASLRTVKAMGEDQGNPANNYWGGISGFGSYYPEATMNHDGKNFWGAHGQSLPIPGDQAATTAGNFQPTVQNWQSPVGAHGQPLPIHGGQVFDHADHFQQPSSFESTAHSWQSSEGAHGQPLPIPDDQVFDNAGHFQQYSSFQPTAPSWQSPEGAHGQPLPIPDDQVFDNAGHFQQYSSFQPTAPSWQSPEGAHGQPLPIPDDQVFDNAGHFQQYSSFQPTAHSWQSSEGAHGQPLPIPDDQVFDNAGHFQQYSSFQPTAPSWQPSEYTNPPNPSQEKVGYHINRVILDNYPGRDPEIRAELQDESVSADHIMRWARMCVNQVKLDIQKYYTQLESAALGQYYDNSAPPSALTDTTIETALNANFFIAFLYVDSESKQLMFGHPYSDKMFREINQEKLEYFLKKDDYFSRVYTIPLDTHHFLVAMALIKQVEMANFSNDPFYKIFTEKDMPPKNNLLTN